jgi:hypothetical protein
VFRYFLDYTLTTTLDVSFVAFIAGAFAAVLLLLSVIDPVFLHFEITQDRSVLFYLGLFTSVLAVARGMIPQDTKVFSPEELITEVVAHTHYMPDAWSERLHSQAVSRWYRCSTALDCSQGGMRIGARRIFEAIRDEALQLLTRTLLGPPYTLHPLFLAAQIIGRHHRFLP